MFYYVYIYFQDGLKNFIFEDLQQLQLKKKA